MDIVEFRTFMFERMSDPNRSLEEKIKIEKEVHQAFLSLEVDSEEEIAESLELLREHYPAVLRLCQLAAEKLQ